MCPMAIILFTQCVFVACSLLAISCAFYRLLLHPLAHVPGPRLAALSNVWHAYHVRNGHMLQLAKKLHHQYGPIVRIGPNEVWCNSRAAFLEVYSATSGFEKSNFYVALALNRPRITRRMTLEFTDTLDLLGEFHMPRYRLQRRLIGPLYQTHNLLRYEQAIDDVLIRAVAQLKSLQGAEVDLKEWMHIITVECLTAVVMSWSPGFIRDKTDHGSGSHAYLGWRRKSVFGLFPMAEVLDSYSRPLGRLFANVWGLTFKTPPGFKALFPLIAQKTRKRINAALRPKPPKDNRTNLAAELILLHKSKPAFTSDYLQRMIMTNFGAGHETTTSALTSAISMIATHPVTQRRILASLKHSDSTIPYATVMTNDHKYTRAAIKEAQRLYPVIGMSLSRSVPAGGVHIDGQYLPAGTTIGCNPASLHRNAEIFGADADEYNPERWLVSDDDDDDDNGAARARVRDMERCNLIYGAGARTCPGRNLAELILLKVVPTLIRHFDVRVTCMPADEEMCYYFMAMMTGVKVRFVQRVEGV